MSNTQRKQKAPAKSEPQLPPIPDKLYFNIGEVAKLCDVKPHVLRYWEEEFTALAPVKRRGNRRYYQRKDVLLVRQIKQLLYVQGFTIEGARIQLTTVNQPTTASSTELLKKLLVDLERVLEQLEPI